MFSLVWRFRWSFHWPFHHDHLVTFVVPMEYFDFQFGSDVQVFTIISVFLLCFPLIVAASIVEMLDDPFVATARASGPRGVAHSFPCFALPRTSDLLCTMYKKCKTREGPSTIMRVRELRANAFDERRQNIRFDELSRGQNGPPRCTMCTTSTP